MEVGHYGLLDRYEKVKQQNDRLGHYGMVWTPHDAAWTLTAWTPFAHLWLGYRLNTYGLDTCGLDHMDFGGSVLNTIWGPHAGIAACAVPPFALVRWHACCSWFCL